MGMECASESLEVRVRQRPGVRVDQFERLQLAKTAGRDPVRGVRAYH